MPQRQIPVLAPIPGAVRLPAGSLARDDAIVFVYFQICLLDVCQNSFPSLSNLCFNTGYVYYDVWVGSKG